MGIKQLGKFLKSSCPSAMNSHSPAAEYKDQTVAIDVSCCLYQCITAMGDTPRGVQPGSELDTSHIAGLLRRSIRLLELGIKPIFIFDGEAPMMKSHVLQQREKNRAKSRELLEEAQAMGDQEAMKRYGARLVKVTQRQNDEARELLGVMGLPAVLAPGEAERLCAQLALNGLAQAAATEDFDALAFGAPKVLRNLHQGSASPQVPLVQEIRMPEILAQLHFSQEEFVDFCILAGCDYLPTISKMGIMTAQQLIKKHRNIESILRNLDRAKYKVPEDWNFQGARQCFCPMDLGFLRQTELKEKPVDAGALRRLLLERHSLPPEMVDENMRKLITVKGCLQPPRPLQSPPPRVPKNGQQRLAANVKQEKKPRERQKKQFGSRPPATPQKKGSPLRQAFFKGKRTVVDEASPVAKRRRHAVAMLQHCFGDDLLLPAETPLAELERLVQEVQTDASSQASQCTTLPGSSLFSCLSLEEL
ncbi:unnamed protein product [Durusdinium trenchii]|uniref:Flap endonuclease 1 (FEN-1) (Cell death-related nuclease 1) (Flap structure-specific endonuclease 1) n=2 Tax=Durusdinium trenchii TaxID=1381693 RepID=A0ABP0NWF4_9DINO